MTPRLTLSVLPLTFAVCRFAPDAPLPPLGGTLFSVTRTADELSLVCEDTLIPAGARAEGGWVALKLHGPFEFSLTGILAAVLNPLKGAGVGIFAISTFDTDYVLVKRERLDAALDALRAAGHTLLDAGVQDAAELE
ncbi:ACT domain-containing protein [Deinococcus sp. KSM4-11]|uniref:ACT domain-containing protein n=1 Tax=Deinococcus sp. KSM4-11 TaxID=2568654 RepID=UPI0010A54E16|nr:ACT domain-containing protein [Deinococcus sp. KSM4-11]THF86549.1 ACT domain-containing protein [Deinococcus sp. KSM4-11]